MKCDFGFKFHRGAEAMWGWLLSPFSRSRMGFVGKASWECKTVLPPLPEAQLQAEGVKDQVDGPEETTLHGGTRGCLASKQVPRDLPLISLPLTLYAGPTSPTWYLWDPPQPIV